jgi:hypothetical protein
MPLTFRDAIDIPRQLEPADRNRVPPLVIRKVEIEVASNGQMGEVLSGHMIVMGFLKQAIVSDRWRNN